MVPVAALSSAPEAPVGTPALQQGPSLYFVILNKLLPLSSFDLLGPLEAPAPSERHAENSDQ